MGRIYDKYKDQNLRIERIKKAFNIEKGKESNII